MLFPLAIITLLLITWMQRNGLKLEVLPRSLLGACGRETAFRTAVAGKYAHLATLAAVVFLVFIALSPESRLFFMMIDAIGFDVFVGLFALQLGGAIAGGWECVRRRLANIRRCLWTPGLGPDPKLLMTAVAATWAYVGIWVIARIVAE